MEEDDSRGYYFEEEPQSRVKAEASHPKKRSLGFFRRAIPSMPLSLAVLCFLFNLVVPGLGTFVSSFSVVSCADGACRSVGVNMGAALLQLLTAPLLVGIIWSWQWGLLFIVVAVQWYRPLEHRVSVLDSLPCSSC